MNGIKFSLRVTIIIASVDPLLVLYEDFLPLSSEFEIDLSIKDTEKWVKKMRAAIM